MQIDIYQIDAFTDQLFGGNPAAICPLQEWLADELLLEIAKENNLAETAFFIPLPNHRYHLRWFTPEIEMDLCGHATLASAFVIFEELNHPQPTILFETQSGEVTVTKIGDRYELDFPSRPPQPDALPNVVRESLNIQPIAAWKARDYVLEYATETDIRNLVPDTAKLNTINLDPGGLIVTAPGQASGVDFVSRFFTPGASVFEDPVTGSAHCSLIPFWAARLNKAKLVAHQISDRGGELYCELVENRVRISGKAVKYLSGSIHVPSTMEG